ncbi:MAG: hypothetical protein WCA84_11820 [Ignavibacteriaceae bacterium]
MKTEWKYSLLVFFILLSLSLLFPPFILNNGNKVYDFIFNSENYVRKTGEQYLMDIYDRKLTLEDTIDAISIEQNVFVDTFYNYKPAKIGRFNYNNYSSRTIDFIKSYNTYTITKPYYIHSKRFLLYPQLIIQIFLSFICSGILFIFLKSGKENSK